MQPTYITNESELTRLEGVYIKETTPAPQVLGKSLSTVGIVGTAVRGPQDKIIEITDAGRFAEVFGGHGYNDAPLTNKSTLYTALLNKRFGKLELVRAVASDAVAGHVHLQKGGPADCVLVTAGSKGAWSANSNLTVDVVAATDADANHFDLVVHYGTASWRLKNLDCYSASDDNLETVRKTVWDDDSALITLTKEASGRPTNVTGTALAGGADGTIADADFSGTGKGMDLLNAYKGVAVCFVAERDSSTLDTKAVTLCGLVNDRVWLLGTDASSTSYSDAITDAGTVRAAADRAIFCYDHAYTIDPTTETEILTSPKSWMASILSQVDVDVNPGAQACKTYLGAITRLYNEALTRENYISLKEAGIAALERDDDGYDFVSAVTLSLTSGKEQITRRRMVDYLQLGIGGFCKYLVKSKNTIEARTANAGAVSAWLTSLAKEGRVIDVDASGVPLFVVDTEKLNSTAQRAAGVEKLYVGGKLISHALHFEVVTDFSTGWTSGS